MNRPQLPLNLSPSQQSTKWKSILDPVIAAPMVGANILTGVALKNGTTVINHLLGAMQQGWFLVDVNGAATIYRSAPFNDKTLTLTSSAAVTVSIGVF
jgi:hypothetical protein